MRSMVIACAFLFGAASAAPALANMCRTDSGRSCPTGMPVDGYCMCGNQDGTVAPSSYQKKTQRPQQSEAGVSRPVQ